MKIRSPALLKAARGQACVMCNRRDGTVVAAHYSGKHAGRLGKGMGTKVWDHCTAHLCRRCHEQVDSYAGGNDDERAALFLVAILQTQARLIEQGVIKLP